MHKITKSYICIKLLNHIIKDMALDKSTFTLPVLSSKDQIPYESKIQYNNVKN